MKFGKRLEKEEYAPYKGFYIQYKELKKALKVLTGEERDQATVQEVTHWTSSFLRLGPNPEIPPEAKFNSALETELKRVGKFAALQEDGLRSQLSRLEEEAKSGADKAQCLLKLEELGEQIVQLKAFAQLNFTGFRKILKKYDKWSKSTVLAWFMGKVMCAELMTVDYDGLLTTLNRIAQCCGGLEQEEDASSRDEGAPSQISLLLTPQDTMRVKVQLAKHLRLLPKAQPSVALAPGKTARHRSTCCYFDTEDYSLYMSYIADAATDELPATQPMPLSGLFRLRDDGGDAVRLVRTAMSTSETEVQLSRAAAKEAVRGSYVPTPGASLAEGPPDVTSEALLGDFRAAVQRGLRPVAQASFRTTEFEAVDGTQLKVSVDEDVKMAPVQEWGGATGTMEFFHCNVLQIWGCPRAMPPWLSCIQDGPHVTQAPGFCLALQAVARCCVKDTGLPLPRWYRNVMDSCAYADDEEKQSEGYSQESEPKPKPPKVQLPARLREGSGGSDMSRALSKEGGGQRSACARLLHDFGPERPEAAVEEESSPAADTGSLGASLLSKPKVKEEKPVRAAIVTVQPKTLYSNERTFLEWIHFATIFAALGLGMIHGETERVPIFIGRGLLCLAIALVMWSLYVFRWRADALDKKAMLNYADNFGPPVLIVSMLAALGFSSLHALQLLPHV